MVVEDKKTSVVITTEQSTVLKTQRASERWFATCLQPASEDDGIRRRKGWNSSKNTRRLGAEKNDNENNDDNGDNEGDDGKEEK